MGLALMIGLLLFTTFCLGIRLNIEEDNKPCSRYDFEHQLLDSLVRLEQSHKALAERLNVLERRGDVTSSENRVKGNYVRWGRTVCPENAETVYKGYAGGSFYSHTGAASNYLCLPEQPQWSNKTSNDNTENSVGAQVYGAEYEMSESHHFFGRNIHEQDVPCAVCDTPRSSILMIPGRITCYDGWNIEYVGYLMAGHYNHAAATEYVCMDETPEILPDASKNVNGKLFYMAEARCGSLKCPPYVNGRVLSCVVCSK